MLNVIDNKNMIVNYVNFVLSFMDTVCSVTIEAQANMCNTFKVTQLAQSTVNAYGANK